MEFLQAPQEERPPSGQIALAPDEEESACEEFLQAPQEEGPSPGKIVPAPDEEESACMEFLQAPWSRDNPLLRYCWPLMRRGPPVCGLLADSLEEGQHS